MCSILPIEINLKAESGVVVNCGAQKQASGEKGERTSWLRRSREKEEKGEREIKPK